MAGTNLANKLRLKPGMSLWLKDSPVNPSEVLDVSSYKIQTKGVDSGTDAIIAFFREKESLREGIHRLLSAYRPGKLLWLGYPKKESGIPTDLNRDKGWDIVADAGFRPVTQIAFNENWSLLRFRKAEEVKAKNSIEPNPVNLEIPGDLLALLQEKGLSGVFLSMSFTHRKEHIFSILDAKKEETRRKRIDKMISELIMRKK